MAEGLPVAQPDSITFLTVGEGDPFIPAPILAVVAFGIVTSVYILGNRPLASNSAGAWAYPAACVTSSHIVSPAVLRWFRTLVFFHFCAINLLMLSRRSVLTFYFYTNWTWLLDTVFFGLAALVSWQARGKPTQVRLSSLQHAVLAMFHVCLSSTITVDALTWGLLWPMLSRSPNPERVAFYRTQFFSFTSYNTHGANLVLLLLEFAMNQMPYEPYLLGWTGLYSSSFALWAFSYYKATNRWMYPFLNAARPWAFAVYAGIYIGHWVYIGLLFGLWRIRAALLSLAGIREPAKERSL